MSNRLIDLQHITKIYDDNTVPVSYTHLTLPTIDSVEISVVAVSLKQKKKKNNN